MKTLRFLHFSDVHVEDGFLGRVSPLRFLNKRFIGYGNLVLRRRKKYKGAIAKLRDLERFARDENIDVALCTGDYTNLGTAPELRLARSLVQPIADAVDGFVTVPGNHDVYLKDALPLFDKHFGDLLKTDLPEFSSDGVWPQVRLFGDSVAAIAVNSARPNAPVLRSSGRIPDGQIAALRKIVADPRIKDRFVFVLTHYAPRLPSGEPDTPNHGLENADALLEATSRLRHGAILHGHVHHAYQVRVPETALVLSGAGSTTMHRREGLWLYEVCQTGTGIEAWATKCNWDGQHYRRGEHRLPL